MSEMKPVGWFTDDYLSDKSATTYDAEVADRWRQKGWAVTPIFTIPADQVLVPRELLKQLQQSAKVDADNLDASRGIITQYRIEIDRLKAENEALNERISAILQQQSLENRHAEERVRQEDDQREHRDGDPRG